VQPHDRHEIQNPSSTDVDEVLRSLAVGKYVRAEMFNSDDSVVMTIYGEDGAFFLVISVKESTYHYFWNGRPVSGELRAIGGNLFDAEKVCEDLETVVLIAKQFWKTGACLDSVQWISEEIAA
jgi:hypothetical protein